MRHLKIVLGCLAIFVGVPLLIQGILPVHSPFEKRDFDKVRSFFADRNINLLAFAPVKEIVDEKGNKFQKIIYAGMAESARIWGIAVIGIIKDVKTQEIFLDSTFGVGGLASTIMPKDVFVKDVVVEKDGKITVFGRYEGKQITARYLEDGTPDTTFGDNNGILVR